MDERVSESDRATRFDAFVADLEPRLRRALAGARSGDEVGDAVAEAMAYAWENWDRLVAMANPQGYLYRVAMSRSRPRRPLELPAPAEVGLPDLEPRLVPALTALPAMQRSAVWLMKGCGWTAPEVAEALHVSTSTVNTHVERALQRLRHDLGDGPW